MTFQNKIKSEENIISRVIPGIRREDSWKVSIPKIGEKVSGFSLEHLETTSKRLNFEHTEYVSSLELEHKPLVLSFFDLNWKSNYAALYLEILERVYPKIRAFGGNLIVLTPQFNVQLKNTLKKADISFAVYQDIEGDTASKFGVFSKTYPAWQRISGINNNVIIPAVFITDQSQNLAYAHVDETFQHPFVARHILEVLYKLSF